MPFGFGVASSPVEEGRTNPFLHLSMHLSLVEQHQIDQPRGVRQALDLLAMTLTTLQAIAERRVERLVNPDLVQDPVVFVSLDDAELADLRRILRLPAWRRRGGGSGERGRRSDAASSPGLPLLAVVGAT